MIRVRRESRVMPKQAEITVMQANLVDETFAEEICFIFREVHIIGAAQSAVHDSKRMKCQRRKLVSNRVDPSHCARGLKTETGLVGKTHREIIRISEVR